MARFQTKLKHARFVVSPFSAGQMRDFGQTLADDIIARIRRGETIYDTPALPLKPRYQKWKTAHGGAPIRDLTMTGRLLRSIKPLVASENKVTIGFTDSVAAQRMSFNQRRDRQWGLSPKNRDNIRRILSNAIRAAHLIHAVSDTGSSGSRFVPKRDSAGRFVA